VSRFLIFPLVYSPPLSVRIDNHTAQQVMRKQNLLFMDTGIGSDIAMLKKYPDSGSSFQAATASLFPSWASLNHDT
jgi:hypothetical protein